MAQASQPRGHMRILLLALYAMGCAPIRPQTPETPAQSAAERAMFAPYQEPRAANTEENHIPIEPVTPEHTPLRP